jgi:hypothetical protein
MVRFMDLFEAQRLGRKLLPMLAKGYDRHPGHEECLTIHFLEFDEFPEPSVSVLSFEHCSSSFEQNIAVNHQTRVPVPVTVNVIPLRGIYTLVSLRLRLWLGCRTGRRIKT